MGHFVGYCLGPNLATRLSFLYLHSIEKIAASHRESLPKNSVTVQSLKSGDNRLIDD